MKSLLITILLLSSSTIWSECTLEMLDDLPVVTHKSSSCRLQENIEGVASSLHEIDAVRRLIITAESFSPKLSLSHCLQILQASYIHYQDGLAVILEKYPESLETFETFYAMILCKVAVILNSRVKREILKILTTIDQTMQYWHYQANHPIYYFFHKSPYKWITGPRQSIYIQKKLQALQSWYDHYAYTLGLFVSHLDFLSIKGDGAQRRAWITQYVSIIHLLDKTEWKPDAHYTNTHVEIYLEQAIQKLMNCPVYCMKSMKQLFIPSSLERDWVFYGTAACAGIYTARYFNNHPGKLAEWQHKIVTGITNFYINHLQSPINRMRSALIENSIDKDFIDGSNKKIKESVEKIEQNLPKKGSMDDIKNLWKKFCQSYYKYLRENAIGAPEKEFNGQQLIILEQEAIDGFDANMLLVFINHVIATTRGAKMWTITGELPIKSMVTFLGEIITISAMAMKYYVGDYSQDGSTVIKETLQRTANILADLERLMLQSKLTFGAVLLLPTIGLTYCGFKIMKSLIAVMIPQGYDFLTIKRGIDALRRSMVEKTFISKNTR